MKIPTDTLERLALDKMRAQRNYVELDIQLAGNVATQPMVTILHKAMCESAEAMVALSVVKADEPELIRTLQMKVCAFDNLVRWTKEVIGEGKEAEHKTTEEEREAVRAFLLENGMKEQAAELGLDDEE